MVQRKYKVKHIFDGEYGCEELLPGEKIKCSVTLINESGEEKTVMAEDEWLTQNGVREGAVWPDIFFKRKGKK